MKQLTADQQAKQVARREKFKALWKQVAAMPELERVQLSNKFGLRTVEGRELSLCNQMLVALQLPAASVVGGFRQWIKQGRAVRKGEHGAMIWCPTGQRNANGTPQSPLNGNAVPADGDSDIHFIIGTVFDIGQTDELKNKDQAKLAGNPEIEIVTVNAELPAGRINTLELITQ
jgi:hypothetical protein